MIRLGNGDVKVREFEIVFPFALSRMGRAEDITTTFSLTFTSRFQSMLMIDKISGSVYMSRQR